MSVFCTDLFWKSLFFCFVFLQNCVSDREGNMIQHGLRDDRVRCSYCFLSEGVFRSCVTQTSLWKRSLSLFSIGWLVLEVIALHFQRAFFLCCPLLFLQSKHILWRHKEGGGGVGLSILSITVPSPQSISMQSLLFPEYSQALPQGVIRSTRVQPPGDSVPLVLWWVSCTHPLWGEGLGPGSGRWRLSGAIDHLWSGSEDNVMPRSVKMWKKFFDLIETWT